jgi:hypothetical protein
MLAASEARLQALAVVAPKLFERPQTAKPVTKPNLPQGWIYLAAGASGLALAFGALVLFRRRELSAKPPTPVWLEEARARVPDRGKRADHLAECDELEVRLIPDIRARGRAALARAHQLELYSRFVARGRFVRPGVRLSPAEMAEWRQTTLAALRAVAPSLNHRSLDAFKEARFSLGALRKEDATAVREHYDRMGALLKSQDEAWLDAKAALEAKDPDQKRCVAAMEKLRDLHGQVAKDSAGLVGDIEVRVRSVA